MTITDNLLLGPGKVVIITQLSHNFNPLNARWQFFSGPDLAHSSYMYLSHISHGMMVLGQSSPVSQN